MTSSPRLVRKLAQLACLACLGPLACQQEPPLERGHSAAATRSALPPAGTVPQVRAQTTASKPLPDAPASPTPPPVEHCKAQGDTVAVGLGSVPDEELQLHADGGQVYVLGYQQPMARVRWSRIARSGGKLVTIAERSGLGNVSQLATQAGAAYFTQAGKLIQLGPQPEVSRVLYERAHSPVAIHGGHAYFVECDRKGKADYLKELPLAGGETRTLATLPKPSGMRCEYSSLAVDDRDVVIADWNEQRVVAVARADGAMRTLASKKGFPQTLLLEPQSVTFLSARGLERVDRANASSLRLLDGEKVAAPFSRALLRGGEYWLSDQLAYITTVHLFRLPYSGGEPQAVVTLRHRSPVEGTVGDEYLSAFTVDDECIYWVRSRYDAKAAELLAKAR
jgi:hypothetical protein